MSSNDETSPISRADAVVQYARAQGLPALVSGLGGAAVVSTLAAITEMVEQVLLIASFGASCVLLFALPQSPLARPRNVIGGHVLSALAGLLVLDFVGGGVIAMGVGVGLAISVMQFTKTLHPPAGGNPLVIILTGTGWSFLLLPVLAGTAILVCLAWLYHRFVSKRAYPAPA